MWFLVWGLRLLLLSGFPRLVGGMCLLFPSVRVGFGGVDSVGYLHRLVF